MASLGFVKSARPVTVVKVRFSVVGAGSDAESKQTKNQTALD